MLQCEKCKEFFNLASLAEVCEHMHTAFKILLDKDYFGKEIRPENENKN